MEINPLPENQPDRTIALLEENKKLLTENNHLLRKMRRTTVVASILRFVWFLILLGVVLYAYFTYIQPNFENIKQRTSELESMLPDKASLKSFYDEMKAKGINPTEVEKSQ